MFSPGVITNSIRIAIKDSKEPYWSEKFNIRLNKTEELHTKQLNQEFNKLKTQNSWIDKVSMKKHVHKTTNTTDSPTKSSKDNLNKSKENVKKTKEKGKKTFTFCITEQAMVGTLYKSKLIVIQPKYVIQNTSSLSNFAIAQFGDESNYDVLRHGDCKVFNWKIPKSK